MDSNLYRITRTSALGTHWHAFRSVSLIRSGLYFRCFPPKSGKGSVGRGRIFFNSSGRRDFAPYTTPAQSHHPLRGFVWNWRPREFGSTLEPDAIKADTSAEFTSGRRDLNPGPPYSHPFSGFRSVRSEGVISPLPRNQSATGIGYYGFCWGLVGGLSFFRFKFKFFYPFKTSGFMFFLFEFIFLLKLLF